MNDATSEFGTGLRAHLGLERAELDLVAEPETQPQPDAVQEPPAETPPADASALPAFAARENELLERERGLVMREASLAGRAGSLLAAAQALYDEVLGGPSPHDDELAQLRRRKSIA